MSETSQHTNALIDATSPYLLQHAHNPVDWYPWGPEALEKAREENKPILLSIGYSSCHWCHVMAHESFEDESVAAIMNEHFVNIKLDREERPDIDQVYMDAVQAMGLQGGWPLNVFLFPDQKPFYGGTYFPKENWKKLLLAIAEAFQKNSGQLYESAERFTENLNRSEAAAYGLGQNSSTLSDSILRSGYEKLSTRFDTTWGGIRKAPKFPMPSVWKFVLHYYYRTRDTAARKHVLFTLDKIAAGGIYDHIGGGFARYSVDGEWHVPHFEKMLYDNGQLLSLYAIAYKSEPKESYKTVLMETANWLKREMQDETGGFYAALDADSEGVEGKFYVWSYNEVKALAGEHGELIAAYYDVRKNGNWEGTNVLRRLESDAVFCERHNLERKELTALIEDFKARALAERSTRVRPGLDSKLIAGWNGLALTGLCDAYQATGEPILLELARECAHFLQQDMVKDGKLIRVKGQTVGAFLEDYAAVIQSFIKYYETTFDESVLLLANELTAHVVRTFFDEKEWLFYFTSDQSESLIARKKELFDNVIPSSNSLMAENLWKLGIMMDNREYKDLSVKMTGRMSHLLSSEPEYLSYWSALALNQIAETAEVIVIGEDAYQLAAQINRQFIPDKVIMAATEKSPLPLFEFKEKIQDQSTIFVCHNKHCKRPVHSADDAVQQLFDR